MVQFTLGNSYSKVEGLTPSEFNSLREVLSYKVEAREAFYGGGHRSNKRYLLNKKGEFPSGLWYHVNRWVNTQLFTSVCVDTRQAPRADSVGLKMNLGDKIPRLEQREAADAAVRQARGVIRMPTRTGKSLVMGLIANKLNVRTLIVVPSVGLRDQLRRDITEWFGDTKAIVVENIDSGALRHLTDFDCLILDEAHHAAAKTYRDLNKTAWKGIYYRFFFTATPFRSNSEEQLLMESLTGKVIFELRYKQAVAAGYIVPVEAYYVDVPDTVQVDSNNWRTVYSALIVNNAPRNALISRVMTAVAASGSTLCLLKEIQHGNQIESATGFPFANGQDGQVRMRILEFNLKETPALIGTVGVLGEGMTMPPAEYILITGGGKSRIQLMQNIGRGLGLYPGKDSCKVILFRDKSHKFLLRHFQSCVKVLRDEYGIKPVRLEI